MIVDDEPLIRQEFLAQMDHLGIPRDEVYEASNGREALEILEKYQVDIAVTDIRMPNMDGLTFIRRAKEIQKDIRFVILSGYAEFSYAQTALVNGFVY